MNLAGCTSRNSWLGFEAEEHERSSCLLAIALQMDLFQCPLCSASKVRHSQLPCVWANRAKATFCVWVEKSGCCEVLGWVPCEQSFCDSALQKLQIEMQATKMATQLKVKINYGDELAGRVGMFPGFRLCTVAGGKVYTKNKSVPDSLILPWDRWPWAIFPVRLKRERRSPCSIQKEQWGSQTLHVHLMIEEIALKYHQRCRLCSLLHACHPNSVLTGLSALSWASPCLTDGTFLEWHCWY